MKPAEILKRLRKVQEFLLNELEGCQAHAQMPPVELEESWESVKAIIRALESG